MLTVREIDKEQTVTFIRRYHYSKVMPRLNKYFLGFFMESRLCGVVVLGWGTQPLQTIRKIFYRHSLVTADYIEIGKMCFLPEFNGTKCFGSLVISHLVKWLKANTCHLFLYTLADGIMGKCGYVYQASNFRYAGSFTTSVYRDSVTGEKIHPRSARVLLTENAAFDGVAKRHWLTYGYCQYKGIDKINGRMFRYLYPLTKEAGKLLQAYPDYAGLKNPKDRDLFFSLRTGPGQYRPIPQPQFNKEVCQFNVQKY
ncbi:hypothetical protein [Robinsoniella peoriensis]|uniref:Mom family adenine methylcarbamoylation protein n=1 Tax=Robinsoniella peoriensis TaxID=180332 RepID=UPI00085C7392|nr:hypothetical protein [Robinsoniella peoriensis]